ncbi:MAG TPA: hypothetical protein VGR50_08835, partial [Terriglobales bacterium]|nr:hypothetical protein [Terriglobales bacterium]
MRSPVITMAVMRRLLANAVVLLLCAGLAVPGAVANLASMQSHRACARDAAMHHGHEHCMGMAAGPQHSFAAGATGHDCCNDCCLGLASSNQSKFHHSAHSKVTPVLTTQYLAGSIADNPLRAP